MSTLEIRDLHKSFGELNVLNGISLELPTGTVTSVIGPSGSGKSTLLHILTGALQADSGEVLLDGEPTPRAPFAYMPQQDALLPWLRIIDNAALGLTTAGMGRRAARQQVDPLFETFGIAGTQQLWPRQLSGGMRQRVALLRTVVQDKPILLLDEPFGALDAITREQLQLWLLDIWQQHRWTILLITHDIREAVRLSDQVLVLSDKPATILEQVAVPRTISRGDEFVLDPAAHALEHHLLHLLGRSPIDG